MNLIETQQLTIGYGSKPLLDRINFALNLSKFAVYLVPMGRGKVLS